MVRGFEFGFLEVNKSILGYLVDMRINMAFQVAKL